MCTREGQLHLTLETFWVRQLNVNVFFCLSLSLCVRTLNIQGFWNIFQTSKQDFTNPTLKNS